MDTRIHCQMNFIERTNVELAHARPQLSRSRATHYACTKHNYTLLYEALRDQSTAVPITVRMAL